MVCKTCSQIEGIAEADVLAKESLPDCVEHFEDFGYYGDDLDSYHLKKCPECGTYFAQHDWDHFEEGGAVGVSIKRIEPSDAVPMLEKIMAKIDGSEWLLSKYDVKKIRNELKRLQAS